MLDQWFLEDLRAIHDRHAVAVLLDESGQAGFLLKLLPAGLSVHHCPNDLEELRAKYAIEKQRAAGGKHLIYTQRPLEKLRYAREYAETNGKLRIRHPQQYIREQVHRHLGLQLRLAEEEISTAGKISIGKGPDYWLDLCHKGAAHLFALEEELPQFLHDPKGYAARLDPDLYEAFSRKVHDAIGEHYSPKPPQTLAEETAKKILEGLQRQQLPPLLEKAYFKWLDSVSYRDSFAGYLKRYPLQHGLDCWAAHPSHPFEQLDRQQLREIAQHLDDKAYLQKKKAGLQRRSKDRIARQLGITWWAAVLELLYYDPSAAAKLNSLEDCLRHYAEAFWKLDHAIRVLYTAFLTEPQLIAPWQAHYQRHLLPHFLDKWFQYVPGYQPAQQGLLSQLIATHETKTAVVVGDGISYELAQQVRQRIGKEFAFAPPGPGYLLAAYPTETEHNMSQLYLASGEVLKVHKQRERRLQEAHPGKDIGFMPLEQVNAGTSQHHYLICSYKDLDELGEKQQQRALKYFGVLEETLAEKIKQLLRNGYQQVYLISDHGFVLTGLLSESDKIVAQVPGDSYAAERYIRSAEDPRDANLVTFAQEYGEYRYISFAKNIGPFKTPGVYGYSHGGLAPQEVITPYFCWEREKTQAKLAVRIANKDDLRQGVLGNLFSVKLAGAGAPDDLFQAERRVQLLVFHGGKEVMRSDIIRLQHQQQLLKEFSFDGKEELELRVIDAVTKETLDAAVVKQDRGRDLGGLI